MHGTEAQAWGGALSQQQCRQRSPSRAGNGTASTSEHADDQATHCCSPAVSDLKASMQCCAGALAQQSYIASMARFAEGCAPHIRDLVMARAKRVPPAPVQPPTIHSLALHKPPAKTHIVAPRPLAMPGPSMGSSSIPPQRCAQRCSPAGLAACLRRRSGVWLRGCCSSRCGASLAESAHAPNPPCLGQHVAGPAWR